MIYTKPLYMIRVSSFDSVTLTIGYNVIPKEELPLITKKTFGSIDLERNGFEFIANHYRQDDIVARFSGLHLVFNSMEPPNTNDEYNAMTLSKHIINNYDFENRIELIRTLEKTPIILLKCHGLSSLILERNNFIKSLNKVESEIRKCECIFYRDN